MGSAILSLALLWATSLGAPAKTPASLECKDPDTGDTSTVKVAALKQELARLKTTMGKQGIHALDLSEAARDHRRSLDSDLQRADWCRVNEHVRAIEGSVNILEIGEGLVSTKFGRVERWLRGKTLPPESASKAERLIAQAAAMVSDSKWSQANVALNQLIAVLFGTKTLWDLPADLPDTDEGPGKSGLAVDAKEVRAACPGLAKQGRGSRDDLDDVIERLRKQLRERKLRPLDIQDGEALIEDLNNYRRLGAVWPAIRVGCAFLARAKAQELDLGVVMKRFHTVSRLRESRPLAEDQTGEFTQLVRNASDHIAGQRFVEAHEELEKLLKLLGEPNDPLAALRAPRSEP